MRSDPTPRLLAAAILATLCCGSPAQSLEQLDRGVVAMATTGGHVYVGWRLLASDPADIAFDVFRSAESGGARQKLNAGPVRDSCNFVDIDPDSPGMEVYAMERDGRTCGLVFRGKRVMNRLGIAFSLLLVISGRCANAGAQATDADTPAWGAWHNWGDLTQTSPELNWDRMNRYGGWTAGRTLPLRSTAFGVGASFGRGWNGYHKNHSEHWSH